MQVINSFWGEYRFLSNFHPCVLNINDYVFPSVEHAYQAAKSLDPVMWDMFLDKGPQLTRTAAQAKRLGKNLVIRPDWDEIKIDVMRELIEIKFTNPQLRQLLVNTGDAQLVEGNNWGDTFWGVCRGYGHNHLGQLLMQERSKWNA